MHLPLREALSGLAPTRSTACPRCGSATIAFANGRGRLDICQPCGVAEATTTEGLELFEIRDMTVRKAFTRRGRETSSTES